MAADKTFERVPGDRNRAARPVRRHHPPALHRREAGASVSGETFENHSPVDSMLPRRGGIRRRRRHRRRGDGGARRASPTGRGAPARSARRSSTESRTLIVERADEIAAVECVDTGQTIRFMSGGRDPRRRELPVLRRPRSRRQQRPLDARRTPRQLLEPLRARPGRRDHSVEHAVHAVDVEDRPGARRRLHGRAQAGGVEPVHRRDCSPRSRSTRACPAGVLNTVHGFGETAGKALTEHPAIKAIAFVGESATGSMIQAQGAPTLKRRALRARRQEPGDRVRRRRPRPRPRRGRCS